MMKKKRLDLWSVVSFVLLGLFLLFLVYPLGKLLIESVYTEGNFSMDAFRKFFSQTYYYTSI
ncbi:MAG: ABC-type Fe3+ transport system, permease component, partial [Herbinix sp.]|nr:ABC-type Fe3+ transport system, permease component [Herbinix sp.]